jgi:hypothetical protein
LLPADNVAVLGRRSTLGVISLVSAYVVVRVWMFAGSTPLLTPDSRDYLRQGSERLLSTRFFSDYKPWFAPLFYKLVPGGIDAALSAQLVVSIAAWLFLANALRVFVASRRYGTLAGAAVLALSCSSALAQWDAAVLSESLSLSLAAIFVGLILLMTVGPTWKKAALVEVVGLAWSGTRDTNAYLVALVLVPLALGLFIRRRQRVWLALAVGAFAVLGFATWSASSPARWEILMIDNINERVLGSSAETYFRAHGMPSSPDLRRRLFADRSPMQRFDGDPSVADFRAWLRRDKRHTYLTYLISHPSYSVVQPLRKLTLLDSTAALSTYRPEGFRRLPGPIEALIFPASGGLTILLSVVAIGGMLLGALRRATDTRFALAGLLILSTVPHAILIWDAEPKEIARHVLLVGVLNRLALLMALVLFAEVLFARAGVGDEAAGSPSTRPLTQTG